MEISCVSALRRTLYRIAGLNPSLQPTPQSRHLAEPVLQQPLRCPSAGFLRRSGAIRDYPSLWFYLRPAIGQFFNGQGESPRDMAGREIGFAAGINENGAAGIPGTFGFVNLNSRHIGIRNAHLPGRGCRWRNTRSPPKHHRPQNGPQDKNHSQSHQAKRQKRVPFV